MVFPAQGATAVTQPVDPTVLHDLAPTGPLRAAINFGNSVLAGKDAFGAPTGIAVTLARALASRLGCPVTFVGYDAAGRVFDAATANAWDIAFLAVDPKRAEDITFTAPYVVIEGSYLVARESPFQAVGDVDQPGVRVAVGKGSAYDLYLTRALHRATIVRAPTSPAAIDLYVADHLDVAAGVKNPLVAYAAAHPGFRVLPGRFMTIEQAMGTPKGRGEAGARYLRAFVEDIKASGFVAEAIKASGQADATVAPAATAK